MVWGICQRSFQPPFVQEGALAWVLKGRLQQEGVEVATRLHCDHHVFFQDPASPHKEAENPNCLALSCKLRSKLDSAAKAA